MTPAMKRELVADVVRMTGTQMALALINITIAYAEAMSLLVKADALAFSSHAIGHPMADVALQMERGGTLEGAVAELVAKAFDDESETGK